MRNNVRALLVLAVIGLGIAHATDAPEDVQAVFSRAAELVNSGHYAEALPLLKDLASQLPQSPGVFWNLGLAAAQSGDERLALRAYSRYHELMPDERRGSYKLIQTYQALGRLKERDRVREQLIAYRNALPSNERDQLTFYVRDQFDVAGQHFMVLEYFEPQSPMRLYYKFTSVDGNHKAIYNFTLTSGDTETTAVRQLGQIGAHDRLYGLDKNEDGKSTLYGLMKSLPSYDEVRSRVIDAVTDAVEGKPIPKTSLQ
jgi:tetratricopeptide (TPR) repeat protein